MLLYDENLPRKLVDTLSDLYPNSEHVLLAGMETRDDEDIWSYASQNGKIIVSKDRDFFNRSRVYGSPPKVIWLRCGNCSTSTLESVLRQTHETITQFASSESESVLQITLRR